MIKINEDNGLKILILKIWKVCIFGGVHGFKFEIP